MGGASAGGVSGGLPVIGCCCCSGAQAAVRLLMLLAEVPLENEAERRLQPSPQPCPQEGGREGGVSEAKVRTPSTSVTSRTSGTLLEKVLICSSRALLRNLWLLPGEAEQRAGRRGKELGGGAVKLSTLKDGNAYICWGRSLSPPVKTQLPPLCFLSAPSLLHVFVLASPSLRC